MELRLYSLLCFNASAMIQLNTMSAILPFVEREWNIGRILQRAEKLTSPQQFLWQYTETESYYQILLKKKQLTASRFLCLAKELISFYPFQKYHRELVKLQHQLLMKLQLHEICDQIKAMGFYTTPGNTGGLNGECILLEQKLQKDVLWLAWRHEMLEVMLEVMLENCCFTFHWSLKGSRDYVIQPDLVWVLKFAG